MEAYPANIALQLQPGNRWEIHLQKGGETAPLVFPFIPGRFFRNVPGSFGLQSFLCRDCLGFGGFLVLRTWLFLN